MWLPIGQLRFLDAGTCREQRKVRKDRGGERKNPVTPKAPTASPPPPSRAGPCCVRSHKDWPLKRPLKAALAHNIQKNPLSQTRAQEGWTHRQPALVRQTEEEKRHRAFRWRMLPRLGTPGAKAPPPPLPAKQPFLVTLSPEEWNKCFGSDTIDGPLSLTAIVHVIAGGEGFKGRRGD